MSLTKTYKQSVKKAIEQLESIKKTEHIKGSLIIENAKLELKNDIDFIISELNKCLENDTPLSFINWQKYEFISTSRFPWIIKIPYLKYLINIMNFFNINFTPFGSEHSRNIYDEALTPSVLTGDIGHIKVVVRGFYRAIRDTTLILLPFILAPIKTTIGIAVTSIGGVIYAVNLSFSFLNINLGFFSIIPTIIGIGLGGILGLGLGTLAGGALAAAITIITATNLILSILDLAFDNFVRRPYNFIKSLRNKSNDSQRLAPTDNSPALAYEQLHEQQLEPQHERTPSKYAIAANPNMSNSKLHTPPLKNLFT